jgi:hypothetical protein
LQASGAKKDIIEDLERASDALKPFADHPIKDFGLFLTQAEEYARTGIVPVQAKTSRGPRSAKPKLPALTLEGANILLTSLYDRATGDDVTHEHIAAEIQKLDKLSAKDLGEAAKQFGLVPGKSKKATLAVILEKISRWKTTHARNQF